MKLRIVRLPRIFACPSASSPCGLASYTALRSTGLTAEQSLLLDAIAAAGSPRAADLSCVLGLDPSTVASNLKPLVRQNWVIVSVDVDDRRARRIFLTEGGRARLDMALKHLKDIDDALAVEIGGSSNARALCQALCELTKVQ